MVSSGYSPLGSVSILGSSKACGLAVLEWQPHPPAAAGCLPTHAPAETGGRVRSIRGDDGFYHQT